MIYDRKSGNTRKIAEQLDHLGYMTRHAQDDGDRALAYFKEAAELLERVGDWRERLAALLELAEIDPGDATADQAVAEALEAGLPEDLHHTEDTKRLAFARRLAGNVDGSLQLYDRLTEDALAKGRKARAAMLLRDVACIHEDDKDDPKLAVAVLESALTLAEDARDTEEIGAALLRLTDIYVECGDERKALEIFERVENMRGLPSYQRQMIAPMRSYFDDM